MLIPDMNYSDKSKMEFQLRLKSAFTLACVALAVIFSSELRNNFRI